MNDAAIEASEIARNIAIREQMWRLAQPLGIGGSFGAVRAIVSRRATDNMFVLTLWRRSVRTKPYVYLFR